MSIGSIIGAALPVIGGLFGRKKERKAQQNAQRQTELRADHEWDRDTQQREKEYDRARDDSLDDYHMMRDHAKADQFSAPSRARDAALESGFNPLTVMGAMGGGFMGGGAAVRGAAFGSPTGSGQVGTIAPLASTSIIQGALQGASDYLTSRDTIDDELKKTRLELEKVRLDQLKAGGAAATVARTAPAPGANGLGVKPQAKADITIRAGSGEPAMGAGPMGLWNVMPKVGSGTVKENESPDVRRQHEGSTRMSYTRPDGSIIAVPVGPDPEEIAAGWAMENVPELWRTQVDRAKAIGTLLTPTLGSYKAKAQQQARDVRDWFKDDKKRKK
ncbi:MAG: hypothetical protein [Microviridae sp.]|nr:MAG: hypothetical protein [Microviridae sp.]